MKKSFLFLTVRMAPGFGVSVAIAEIAKRMQWFGAEVSIGCLEKEGEFPELKIYKIGHSPEEIDFLASSVRAKAVIANTSPFFEALPRLSYHTKKVALEYGDPTPEFFTEDAEIRRQIVENKLINVYPKTNAVIAISEFIRFDINWPKANVIYLGADHVPDLPPKSTTFFETKEHPLKIGTLMRLGKGEAKYKGNTLFLKLAKLCQQAGIKAEFAVMGRGTVEDREEFETQGIKVHLNANDTERTRYLRNLDVFVSCSQWEGFNLPLVEAQALGTASIAFDVGAHSEVTPLVMPGIPHLLSLLKRYQEKRALLCHHSKMCRTFVRSRFSWDKTALELFNFLTNL